MFFDSIKVCLNRGVNEATQFIKARTHGAELLLAVGAHGQQLSDVLLGTGLERRVPDFQCEIPRGPATNDVGNAVQ